MDREPHNNKLVPEEAIASLQTGVSSIESFGRIIFIVVLVQALLLIGLNLYQKNRITAYDKKIAETKTALASTEYAALNNKVEQVLSGSQKLETILGSKVVWSKFYSQLNAVTPKDVKITGLAISETGVYKADGETASLTSLAQLLVVWGKGSGSTTSPFSTAVLNSNGYADKNGTRRIIFTISGQINTSLLR